MYQLYRCLNKLAKILDVSVLYQTKVGIKSLNQLMQSQELYSFNEFYANPNELYLGFDALKDAYTLVDVCIDNSPHFFLMEALNNHLSIKNTEYCQRYKAGTLDSRARVSLSHRELQRMEEKFALRKQEILEGRYAPVQVYRRNGKYYIADGKHRAALCTLFECPIKCVEISADFLKDSFRKWIYRKMYKKQKEYTRNLMLYENEL